jgi:hypothetical protein
VISARRRGGLVEEEVNGASLPSTAEATSQVRALQVAAASRPEREKAAGRPAV